MNAEHSYLSEEQKNAIKALEIFDGICKKHGLKYYLLAGTTLGAVRHKGMIPWDDDVDIGMLYDDWHRVKNILVNELPAPFYYCDSQIDGKFPRLFGKILCDGLSCIDIFLIAKWTYKPVLGFILWQVRRTATINFKYSIGYKYATRPNTALLKKIRIFFVHILRRIIYIILLPFCDSESYIKLARRVEKFFEGKDFDCYINLYSIYSMKKEMIKKEWIETQSFVEYEGNMYPTVGNTDAYLKHLYGDYMTLPPERQRLKMHQEKFE